MVKWVPGAAARFLELLIDRIWVSQFVGQQTDRLSGSSFCGEGAFSLSYTSSGQEQWRNVRLPRSASSPSHGIWQYFCTPVKILSAPLNKQPGRQYIKLAICQLDTIDMVLSDLAKVVSQGDIGKYRVTQERAAEIVSETISRFPSLAPSIGVRPSFATYPYIDLKYGEQEGRDGHRARAESIRENYRRLRATGLSKGNFLRTEKEGLLEITIEVFPNYFTRWHDK